MSGGAIEAADAPASARDGRQVKDAWVSRVLGIQFGATAGRSAAGAARLAQARPDGPPKTALTGNLLTALGRLAPGSAEELPAVLSEMIPRFLLAIQGEPAMQAEPLAAGAAVPAQDQLLSVADSLNAVLRSARRWEELLAEAEAANKTLDGMEGKERDEAAQAEHAKLVGSYNATRTASLAEEERCVALADTLMAEFRAAQGAMPGAMKGAAPDERAAA